jgi:IS30 family transposase
MAVSRSTIYRAVNAGDLDCELPGWHAMRRRLRHRGKRRHPKGSVDRRGRLRATHEISERPPEASGRSRVGDWEGDTVVGRAGGPRLVTEVDRMSGYLVGGKAASGASADVGPVVVGALAGEPVRTLTLDRGVEFADASGMQEALGAPIYYCLPHHPWQRGTNENTNGLLREYFPKGTDLSEVSDGEVAAAYDDLNHRPRKRLGWRCTRHTLPLCMATTPAPPWWCTTSRHACEPSASSTSRWSTEKILPCQTCSSPVTRSRSEDSGSSALRTSSRPASFSPSPWAVLFMRSSRSDCLLCSLP